MLRDIFWSSKKFMKRNSIKSDHKTANKGNEVASLFTLKHHGAEASTIEQTQIIFL